MNETAGRRWIWREFSAAHRALRTAPHRSDRPQAELQQEVDVLWRRLQREGEFGATAPCPRCDGSMEALRGKYVCSRCSTVRDVP